MTLLRRGMILAGLVLVSVLGGFCLCLLLHRKPQEPRSPVGPTPSTPAPGFVPPTGKRPKPSADVPRGTPVIAEGGGTVEFGPVITKLGELAPEDKLCESSPGCFLSPEDIGGDCTFEIVGTADAPMLRMKWTGRVRVRDGQQVRGPITLPDAKFDWRPPAVPAPAPRTTGGLNLLAGGGTYLLTEEIGPQQWAFNSKYAQGRVRVVIAQETPYGQPPWSPDTKYFVGAGLEFALGRR